MHRRPILRTRCLRVTCRHVAPGCILFPNILQLWISHCFVTRSAPAKSWSRSRHNCSCFRWLPASQRPLPSNLSHASYQSQLNDSQQRESASAAQLRDLSKEMTAQLRDVSKENDALRAALDKAASAAHAAPPALAAPPASDTLASQNAALRERVSELEEQVGPTEQRLATQPQTPFKLQVEEKQEHLAETAQLVEKMFSEFSTLQGSTARARD